MSSIWPPTPSNDRELTVQQHRFAHLYIEGGLSNATAAAIDAGYAPKSAGKRASILLDNPQVKAVVSAVGSEMQRLTGITIDRTALEIARCGYFDPRRICDAEGNPKPIHELDDDIAAAIAGVEVVEFNGTRAYRYRFVSKTAALELAARVQGMLTRDNAQRVHRTIDDYSDDELLAIMQSECAIRRAQMREREPMLNGDANTDA